MWVRFLRHFDFRPPRTWRGRPYAGKRVMLSYEAGEVRNVPTPCGLAALAAGAATRSEAPER